MLSVFQFVFLLDIEKHVLKQMLCLQQSGLPGHAVHRLPPELLHSPWCTAGSLPAAGHKDLLLEVQTQVEVPSAPAFSGGLRRKYIFLRPLEQSKFPLTELAKNGVGAKKTKGQAT